MIGVVERGSARAVVSQFDLLAGPAIKVVVIVYQTITLTGARRTRYGLIFRSGKQKPAEAGYCHLLPGFVIALTIPRTGIPTRTIDTIQCDPMLAV